jgi:hypothetical protein
LSGYKESPEAFRFLFSELLSGKAPELEPPGAPEHRQTKAGH